LIGWLGAAVSGFKDTNIKTERKDDIGENEPDH